MTNAVHGVLKGHMDDLAGHHLVLKIFKESWTGDMYMRVDRAPLVAISYYLTPADTAADPAVQMYLESLSSASTVEKQQRSGMDATTIASLASGWLYNLAGTMRLEQSVYRVDDLYPKSQLLSALLESRKWSCPLRRLSFWSKVTRDFSPLVPSPARTDKIFGEPSGRNMLHGTRSHPTQLFASMYDRLANVLTSNGFCFCVDWQDCQVAGTNGTCSLLDTVRSMYDGKFRETRLLTRNDRVCTKQLDWPFFGGRMRDTMVSPGRYSAGQTSTEDDTDTCNVFDRLPPFQYR